MLTIHHLGMSQSERIIWLCEELALPYSLRLYNRAPVTLMAPPEYKALHPMGLAPVVEVEGLVLAETGAIVEYIVHRLGGGRLEPRPDEADYPDWLFWFHFANSTLVPSEMIGMVMRALPEAGPMRGAIRSRSDKGFALTEVRLRDHPWLAGAAFTTADIMMVFPFTTMRAFTQVKLDDYPSIRTWLARIGERPAYQRAMAAGDPGMVPLLC